eukprot:GHVS01036202.1.p1 GENE.GHVS01036202.1~~GHVS01036202.1.p1  ORF type:complete len:602 (-),score=182.08 GHVS01036202.1:158-1963(-)
MRGRVPVTVITGFLGAGKTTLLRYVLKQQHGMRIAVVQNEFSEEMGIESPTFLDSDGSLVRDIYELPNGCICCSAKDDFVGSIDRLLEGQYNFEYILVETTGVADPQPLIASFWVDGELDSRVRLDGVITVVDCKHFLACVQCSPKELSKDPELSALITAMDNSAPSHRSPSSYDHLSTELYKQIAYADVVLLNKVDTLGSSSFGTDSHERLLRFPVELTSSSPPSPSQSGSPPPGSGSASSGSASSGSASSGSSTTLLGTAPPPVGALGDIYAAVRAVNSAARVYATNRSAVDLQLLLNLRAYERVEELLGHEKKDEKEEERSSVDEQHSCPHTVRSGGKVSSHVVAVECQLPSDWRRRRNRRRLRCPVSGGGGEEEEVVRMLSLQKVYEVLGKLLWDSQELCCTYRCKGLFAAVDDYNSTDEWTEWGLFTLQGIAEVFEIEPLLHTNTTNTITTTTTATNTTATNTNTTNITDTTTTTTTTTTATNTTATNPNTTNTNTTDTTTTTATNTPATNTTATNTTNTNKLPSSIAASSSSENSSAVGGWVTSHDCLVAWQEEEDVGCETVRSLFRCKFLFIGRNLNAVELSRQLSGCVQEWTI